MRRNILGIVTGLLFSTLLLCGGHLPDPPDVDNLKKKSISTFQNQVGELLRQWWKEGTAAGNAGDFYDNRDADHSPLDLAPYPQLSAIKYTPEEIKARRHWAAQSIIVPHVTFGNSSTSAPPEQGGSNPRSYYSVSQGLIFLYNQYARNNLYIYPEHRDHDPGHNGKPEGYGDMYPTNTPYLIISQGSSGSDQPFMRMMPLVLASFRPEVKKKLAETKLLMPTIQMLFRSTNKHLKDPKEYLTGKAHPTVFEGSWVDELAMMQKAHDLELKALPPMVQMQLVQEVKAVNGIDYFDLSGSETLGATPCCIARIHRSKALNQGVVVHADASFDVNKSPLTYTWVVLRGDPAKIKIIPKKDDQSVVEISVAYHERRPIAPGAALESNRVDIGVFVHNGTYYSAPGFVTFLTLDREARTYDEQGRILELAHLMGETDLHISDWNKLLPRAAKEPLASQLLAISETQRTAFAKLTEQYQELQRIVKAERLTLETVEEAVKIAKKDNKDTELFKKTLEGARQAVRKAEQNAIEILDRKVEALADSPRHFVESRLSKLAQDPLFLQKHQTWLKERRVRVNEPRIKALWQELVRWGIANPDETLTPLRPGKTLADARWTKFELAQLEAFHGGLLAELAFPGMLHSSYHVNFVDPRVSTPREWRDSYHYDAKGNCIGWTRYSADGTQEFNYEGLLVVERDAKGRCAKGRHVRYVSEPVKGRSGNPYLLRALPGDTVVLYEFDGDNDLRGRRKK